MPSDVPSPQIRTAVTERIIAHVAQGWPQLGEPVVRHRGKFCYVGIVLPGSEEPAPILRLRYQGSADRWAIATYLASKERYTESELPTGSGATTGTPEEGIDQTFTLYAGPSVIASPAQAPEDGQDVENAEDLTTSSAKDLTTSSTEDTTASEEDTTPSSTEDTTSSVKDTTPAKDTTTSPAEDTTTSPAEDTTTSPAEDTTADSPDQISAVHEPRRRTFPWPRIPMPRLKFWRAG